MFVSVCDSASEKLRVNPAWIVAVTNVYSIIIIFSGMDVTVSNNANGWTSRNAFNGLTDDLDDAEVNSTLSLKS